MADPRIDYVELPSATAHELTRAFYSKAFGWEFTDYGPTYSATANGTTDIGLQGDPSDALSAALPVVRVDDLEAAFDSVTKAGGNLLWWSPGAKSGGRWPSDWAWSPVAGAGSSQCRRAH